MKKFFGILSISLVLLAFSACASSEQKTLGKPFSNGPSSPPSVSGPVTPVPAT